MDSRKTDNKKGMEMAESDMPDVQDARTWDENADIFERLFLASNMIGRLEKKETVKGGGNYSYASHDYVTARAKEVFAKVGIYHFVSLLDAKQDGNRTTATIEICFVCVGRSGDCLKIKAFGFGVDNQDKGAGKAMSYAVKNGLLKTLGLNTDEDIEAHDIDYDDGQSAKVNAANEEARAAIESWAKTFKTALSEAQSIETVNTLQKENKARLSSDKLPAVTREFFIDLINERKDALEEQTA